MVAKTPDEHFAEYKRNNAVKHRIFREYFRAYLLALGNQVKAFHYVDGFAGRGRYGATDPGSPLLALEQLGKQRLPFVMSLVEASTPDFEQLKVAISQESAPENMRAPPFFANGAFSEHVDAVLASPIYMDLRPTATFAFVDPCGISGLRVGDVAKIIRKPYGECLLFWNYDGFNRILGGVAKDTLPRSKLKDLMGSESFVSRALDIFRTAGNSGEKEHFMCDLLAEALRDQARATHVLPFRFQAEDSARTSHYLIHCSTSGLAFRIMKEVMQSASASAAPDLFGYSGASADRGQFALLRPQSETSARAAILHRLANGPCKVSEITKQWPERPADLLTERSYRRILLNLEDQKELVVLDKAGREALPVGKRPHRNGGPTLGPDLHLALPGNAG